MDRVSSVADGGITALTFSAIVGRLRKLGIAVDEVLRVAALAASDLEDPERRLPLALMDKVIVSVLEANPHAENLGLELGELCQPRDYGVVEYLMRFSIDLRESFRRGVRYMRLLSDARVVDLHFEPDPNGGTGARIDFTPPRSEPPRVDRLRAQLWTASLLTLARMHAGQCVSPVEVRFEFAQPRDLEPYGRVFGSAPVHFAQATTELRFDAATLDLPIHDSDEKLARIVEEHAETELAALPPMRDLEASVRRAIAATASEGGATLEGTAKRLGLSARTLQRRLGELGKSFRQVEHETLATMARRLIDEGKLTFSEIAYLLGFAEEAPFYRAFKRWTGMTPGEYRRLSVRE